MINCAILKPDRPVVISHAHNDYQHEQPLLDALARGFTSIEADIHLVDGELFVAHDSIDIQPGRTLSRLYLDPLRERINKNKGYVFRHKTQLILLIDIKSEAETTYNVLHQVLNEYRDLLTVFTTNRRKDGAVLVIISGNRSRQLMEQQTIRFAGYDGRLADLDSEAAPDFIPLISDNWQDHFTWRGEGAMPLAEGQKLDSIVTAAHDKGRLLRFWAIPEQNLEARESLWLALVKAGVDLIGTDDLDGLQRFLKSGLEANP